MALILINSFAGGELARLLRESGHSPESLAAEIRDRARSAPWGSRGAVDAHTLRRIVKSGHIPGLRIQFVVANFFGLRPEDIWDTRYCVPREAVPTC